MDTLSQKQETILPTALGDIKVKVPTLPQRLLIERKRTAYAGGFAVLSNLGADLAEIFAFVDVVVLECEKLKRSEADPSSWNYDVLTEFDYEKIEDVYKKAQEWLDSFRKGMGQK